VDQKKGGGPKGSLWQKDIGGKRAKGKNNKGKPPRHGVAGGFLRVKGKTPPKTGRPGGTGKTDGWRGGGHPHKQLQETKRGLEVAPGQRWCWGAHKTKKKK